MMTKALIIVATLLGIGFAVQSFRASHLRSAYLDARQEVALAHASLAHAAEVAKVHRAHIERMKEQANRAAEQGRVLQELEGRDAPLSDTLRDAADIMFGPR